MPAWSWALTAWALGAAVPACADPAVAFPYTRTVYVEEMGSPAAWWANPALAAWVDAPTLLTANASPVGKLYTVSSVRFLAPLAFGLRLGVGVSAFGSEQTDTFQATEAGADYQGKFAFSRPDFEIGAAYPFTYAGSVGVLLKAGLERVSVGAGQTENYGVFTVGLGWVSPGIARCAWLSLAAQWTGHFLYERYWDSEGKIGLRLAVPGELVTLDITYARPLPLWLSPSAAPYGWTYQAAKAILSVRTSRLIALLAGASSDFSIVDEHNGTCVHAGLALLPSTVNPFVGGYEIGVSVNERWHFLHRFWVGYRILRRPARDSGP